MGYNANMTKIAKSVHHGHDLMVVGFTTTKNVPMQSVPNNNIT